MRIVSTLSVAVILAALALPASAQPPLPLECKNLPNGGNVKIEGPPIVVPVACQSCAMGIGIPANAVVGFTDNGHATCEFKLPNGDNTGHCKKDTTCGPGFSRVSRNSVWVCEKAGPKVDFTCPAPPKIPDPPAAVKNCIATLKAVEGQVSTSAKTFEAALGKAKPGSIRGVVNTGGSSVQAGTMLGVTVAHFYGTLIPMSLKRKAFCDNVDTKNGTAMSECRAATSDYNAARERQNGLSLKFRDASGIAKRDIGQVLANNANVFDAAGNGVTTAIDTAGKALDACIAEATKLAP